MIKKRKIIGKNALQLLYMHRFELSEFEVNFLKKIIASCSAGCELCSDDLSSYLFLWLRFMRRQVLFRLPLLAQTSMSSRHNAILHIIFKSINFMYTYSFPNGLFNRSMLSWFVEHASVGSYFIYIMNSPLHSAFCFTQDEWLDLMQIYSYMLYIQQYFLCIYSLSNCPESSVLQGCMLLCCINHTSVIVRIDKYQCIFINIQLTFK